MQFSAFELGQLFSLLDQNKDGFIDFGDWTGVIMEPGNALQFIRNVIQQNHYGSDEVLRRMRFNREQGAVNYY